MNDTTYKTYHWFYTPVDYFIILPDHENLGIDIDFITIRDEMTILWRYYIFGLMAARKCGYLGLTAWIFAKCEKYHQKWIPHQWVSHITRLTHLSVTKMINAHFSRWPPTPFWITEKRRPNSKTAATNSNQLCLRMICANFYNSTIRCSWSKVLVTTVEY